MTAQAKHGALYGLVHQKANLLSQVNMIGERLQRDIAAYEEGQELDVFLDAVKARDGKIKEIDQLNRQIAFLEDSGYVPGGEEAGRIALEQGTIRALIGLITKMDEKLSEGLAAIQAGVMESLKDVREGQRSIQAYFPMPEEEEGRTIDTLR